MTGRVQRKLTTPNGTGTTKKDPPSRGAERVFKCRVIGGTRKL